MKALLKDRFVLISRWHLDCTIEAAWQHISQVRDWPRWWPHVRTVRTVRALRDDEQAESTGGFCAPRVGNIAVIEWKTPFGYGLRLRITTTRVAAPFELEGVAGGDLEGYGLWVLEPRSSTGVVITYRWDVHLNRTWMRLVSPLLRPLFARNHAAVMRAGARGLAGAIGCRLLDCQDFSMTPGAAAEALHAPHWP
jgi:hypothetical protein